MFTRRFYNLYMAETNGNRDARMDRIERAMEMFAADHEQFRDEHKKLLIAQVVQQGEIDKLLKITQELRAKWRRNVLRAGRRA